MEDGIVKKLKFELAWRKVPFKNKEPTFSKTVANDCSSVVKFKYALTYYIGQKFGLKK